MLLTFLEGEHLNALFVAYIGVQNIWVRAIVEVSLGIQVVIISSVASVNSSAFSVPPHCLLSNSKNLLRIVHTASYRRPLILT